MPVGLQLMGPRWADALTLRAAAAFERAVPWQRFQPGLPEGSPDPRGVR
jgi:aspartyl-tRNA(Asn)/glutamyl-tRNA(Gln) amidotransferase subunit A